MNRAPRSGLRELNRAAATTTLQNTPDSTLRLLALTSKRAHTRNMNNFQEQGRALYKRGEYRTAVEIFDRAIGRSPSVQLLDNRAACYEKLNELSAALKDAKQAIQLHREDATGYLRAGKVLVKMEKPRVALEIYTHGLKCIKHVGRGYEVSHHPQNPRPR